MRRAAKVDRNQGEIVDALLSVGCSVELLHRVGGGCPDLLVGCPRGNFIMEVKDGDKPPSARELNDEQKRWHARWRGPKPVVVNNVDEALAVVAV